MQDAPDLPQYPFEVGPLGSPPPVFAQWRAREPVTPIRTLAGDTVLLVTGMHDVRTILGDPRFSRSAICAPGAPRLLPGADPGADPNSMGSMDPATGHTRLRRLVNPAFAPRHTGRWQVMAAEQADMLIDAMTAGGASGGDLATGFAYPLPIAIVCRILGIDGDLGAQFHVWSAAFGATTSMTTEERGQALADFRSAVAQLLDTRREAPGAGLLDDLIAARDEADGRLGQDELIRMVCAIIIAGHETTAGVIARGALRLLMTPELWQQLVDDAGAIPAAVEELLRLEVPGHSGRLRMATEDIVLPSGAAVPAGTAVLPIVSAANRDETVFPDPDRYDPARPNLSDHLAFAAGPHFCLGHALARTELVAAFRALTTRLPSLKLNADPSALPWREGTDLVALLSLPVAW